MWNEFPGKNDLGGIDTRIDLVALTVETNYFPGAYELPNLKPSLSGTKLLSNVIHKRKGFYSFYIIFLGFVK
jgi:hypothetical protein